MSEQRRTTLDSLTFTLKELIGVVVFLFSMRGIYYKLYYERENDRVAQQTHVKESEKRFELLEQGQRLINQRLDRLEQQDIIRTTKEQFSSQGYVPLKKK